MNMFKTKTKRLFFASILFFLFLINVPALAAGLVPCGNEGEAACTFNDFFIMVNSVINFVLYDIVPPIAIITIVISAVNLMTSAGDPGKLEQAKKTLIWIIIGLVVVYGAWWLVTTFVSMLGGDSGWTLQFFNNVK